MCPLGLYLSDSDFFNNISISYLQYGRMCSDRRLVDQFPRRFSSSIADWIMEGKSNSSSFFVFAASSAASAAHPAAHSAARVDHACKDHDAAFAAASAAAALGADAAFAAASAAAAPSPLDRHLAASVWSLPFSQPFAHDTNPGSWYTNNAHFIEILTR
jgi:hypothetical protein